MTWLLVALTDAAPRDVEAGVPRRIPGDPGSDAGDVASEAPPDVDDPPGRRVPGPTRPVEVDPVGALTEDGGATPTPPVGSPPPSPVPDRWGLIEAVGVEERWWDPYHQNTLKGDRPIAGMWFANLSLIADASAGLASHHDGPTRTFGALSAGLDVARGDTAFRPPVVRFRAVARVRGEHDVDPLGLRVAHADVLLWSVSPAWDHDMLRVGVQPFSAGPRGLVLRDAQPGVRLFGTRAGNRLQYGVGWYRRLPRPGADGVVEMSRWRDPDDVAVITASIRDALWEGADLHLSAIGHRRRDPLPVRDVVWAGVGLDGRVGRFGVVAEAWGLGGRAALDVADPAEPVRAAAVWVNPSYDVDAVRVRATALAASGDRDPSDGLSTGFDALRENPDAGLILGAWHTGSVDGSGVAPGGWLPGDRGLGAPDVGSPGIFVGGVGLDVAVDAPLRVSGDVAAIALATPRSGGSFVGVDVGAGVTWRPTYSENVRIVADLGVLFPGSGARSLGAYPGGAPRGTGATRMVLQW